MSSDLYVAHGLVAKGSAYLFLRRLDGRYLGEQWDIPGGTVEESESWEEAAARECFEETGLRGSCGELITHFSNPDTEGRDLIFHTMTYRLVLNDEVIGRVKISKEEHDDAQWLTTYDALNLPLVWHVRETLKFLLQQV